MLTHISKLWLSPLHSAFEIQLQAHQTKVSLRLLNISKPTSESLITRNIWVVALQSMDGSDIGSSLWTNHYYVHDWTHCVGIPSGLLSVCALCCVAGLALHCLNTSVMFCHSDTATSWLPRLWQGTPYHTADSVLCMKSSKEGRRWG